MTIPKTHPLYGAVEAMREEFDSISVYGPAYAIRVLEAAGYKVVGPEPTDEMLCELFDGDLERVVDRTLRPWLYDRLQAAIAAAPTITETEKSGE